jgi:transposase-like protein
MAILPPMNPAVPRCPRCRAKNVIKKGTRHTRYEARQRWGCNAYGSTFTHLVTKHSSYPVKVIMEGICHYHLGFSARKTVRYLKRRFGIAVPEKTFRRWYAAHTPVCTYHTIRDGIKRRVEPGALIEKHYLQHRQVYLYTRHHGKLERLFSHPYHRAYKPLRAYLAFITRRDFPHHLFTPDNPVRSST